MQPESRPSIVTVTREVGNRIFPDPPTNPGLPAHLRGNDAYGGGMNMYGGRSVYRNAEDGDPELPSYRKSPVSPPFKLLPSRLLGSCTGSGIVYSF